MLCSARLCRHPYRNQFQQIEKNAGQLFPSQIAIGLCLTDVDQPGDPLLFRCARQIKHPNRRDSLAARDSFRQVGKALGAYRRRPQPASLVKVVRVHGKSMFNGPAMN